MLPTGFARVLPPLSPPPAPAPRPGVKAYIEKRGLLMISDEAAVGAMVDRVLAAR